MFSLRSAGQSRHGYLELHGHRELSLRSGDGRARVCVACNHCDPVALNLKLQLRYSPWRRFGGLKAPNKPRPHRRNDARARCLGRAHHGVSLDAQDVASAYTPTLPLQPNTIPRLLKRQACSAAGLSASTSSPRRVCELAAVMRTSTICPINEAGALKLTLRLHSVFPVTS